MGTPIASADDGTGTLPDLTDPANFTIEEQALQDWISTPVGTDTSADLAAGGYIAEDAAGLVPALAAGAIVIGGGAAAIYTSWKITSSIWRSINVAEASTAAVAGFAWFHQTSTLSASGCATIGESSPCTYWQLRASTAVANPGPNGNFPNPVSGSALVEFCSSGSNAHCSGSSEDANVRGLAVTLGADPSHHDGIGSGVYLLWDFEGTTPPNGIQCISICAQYEVIRSEAQMKAHIHTAPCDSTCQSNSSGGYTLNSVPTFTRPATITSTQLAAALCALGIGSGCSANDPTTPAHKAQIDVLKKAADPTFGFPVAPNCAGLSSSACVTAFSTAGFTATPTVSTASFSGADVAKPPSTVITQSPGASVAADPASTVTITVNPAAVDMPFAIPRPLVGETYADYIARIQSLGYLGAITYIDLDDTSGDPDLGPSGVPRVGIQIGTNTTTVQELTKSWPIPNPQIKAGSGITVYRNPTDFPAVTPEPTPVDPANPPPYEPGAGTPGTGVGGNCGPTVPTVDFAPITGVDFGSKFPFGIFGYIASALSPLVASPSAPVFDVPIYLMGDSFSLHVDFSPADPYMATIRLLMEIGIGITAVWLLAGSLLGFKAGSAGGGLDMDTSMGDD